MVKIVSYLVWFLLYAVSLLPLGFYYFLSDIMAWLLRRVFSYRKSVVTANLARSFPELSYNELRKIEKEYYKYMCDIMVESIWQVSATAKQVCRIVEVEGVELLDRMVAEHGKTVVLTGHRGNWELVGAICGESEKRSKDSFANHPITVTYRIAKSKISNFLFEKMRMEIYRKFDNNGYIVGSKQFLRHVAKSKGSHTYIFIADQYPRIGGVPLKFLNQNTFFFDGAEAVARKMNMPVIYLDMIRIERRCYKMVFSLISENSAAMQKGEITLAYARLLEEGIRKDKYNWLWSHKRWKRGFTEHDVEVCNELCGNVG